MSFILQSCSSPNHPNQRTNLVFQSLSSFPIIPIPMFHNLVIISSSIIRSSSLLRGCGLQSIQSQTLLTLLINPVCALNERLWQTVPTSNHVARSSFTKTHCLEVSYSSEDFLKLNKLRFRCFFMQFFHLRAVYATWASAYLYLSTSSPHGPLRLVGRPDGSRSSCSSPDMPRRMGRPAGSGPWATDAARKDDLDHPQVTVTWKIEIHTP